MYRLVPGTALSIHLFRTSDTVAVLSFSHNAQRHRQTDRQTTWWCQ